MGASVTNVAQLLGRVALITGAGRGQGRAHAVALAEQGCAVVVTDAPERVDTVPYALSCADDLADTLNLVRRTGAQGLAFEVDVRNAEQVTDVVASTVEAFGSVDILIANAGICTSAPVTTLSAQQWADTIDINLTGVFHSIQAVLPHMIERKWGRIVATASMAARGGSPNLAHYTASKFGVIGLVKSVALEVIHHGITVNALCPTTVNTAMIHHDANYRLFCPDLAHPGIEDVRDRFARLNPMGVPWLEPEDVAREMIHLVTDPGYTTGATIEIGLGINTKKP